MPARRREKGVSRTAMQIGTPVFKAMAQPQPDYISSDCALAGHHIEQGLERKWLAESATRASADAIAQGLRPLIFRTARTPDEHRPPFAVVARELFEVADSSSSRIRVIGA